MRSQTGKLPKSESYVLKPSVLGAALAAAGVAIDIHLVRNPGPLFAAHFWPPNQNVPYERLYVQAGSVPRERAAAVRRHVADVVVPQIVAWIADILSRDIASPVRRGQQAIAFTLP
jgi:hypothetical protein